MSTYFLLPSALPSRFRLASVARSTASAAQREVYALSAGRIASVSLPSSFRHASVTCGADQYGNVAVVVVVVVVEKQLKDVT